MQTFENAKKSAFKLPPIMGVTWFPDQPQLIKVASVVGVAVGSARLELHSENSKPSP